MSNSQEIMDTRRACIVSAATAVGGPMRQVAGLAPVKDCSFSDTGGMKWRAMILSRDGAPVLAVVPEKHEGNLSLAVHISSGMAFLSQADYASHSLHVGGAMIVHEPNDEPGLERLMAAFEEARDEFYGADA